MPSETTKSSPTHELQALLAHEAVCNALAFFDSHAEEITQQHINICSIPSSPFQEAERASYLLERFRAAGLRESTIDAEGNCLALRAGREATPLLVLSAHLDTVFPPDTEFNIQRTASRLAGPGVADDGCGLAALMAIALTCEAAAIRTFGSVLFAGTVGEEGEGNLRGVRYLLTEGPWAGRVDAFISLDGPGVERVTNSALGSRRYRVRLCGPGGHSWADFGAGNPVHALGRAVSRLASYPAPKQPRTSFNVGRIEGGSSVNAIPEEARMDVDLRSASQDELLRLDAFFRRAVREAVDDENALRRKGTEPITVSLDLIGERPIGETPADSPIVKIALAATQALGFKPRLDLASTDSNLPISLGIPAVTLGAGGSSGQSHTPSEWYDVRGRAAGLKRALLVMLGLVGIE